LIGRRAIEAIESTDTDELLRVVEGLVSTAAWDELAELRDRCREAVGRGKQVWGIEEHIRYRFALEGPPAQAGAVVSEGPSRFTLGPLPEVAASTKSWAELSPYLTQGPHRQTFAAERVTRGEVVEGETDLPGHLLDWEPIYPVATYKPDKLDAGSPPMPEPRPIVLPESHTAIDDPHSEGALADLVEPWTDQSNGRCQTVAVEGGLLDAVRALGLREARVASLTAKEALRWMAWAGASGGAHGRRRGAAAGRYLAWWAVAVLTDLDWPAPPKEVGAAAHRMDWAWYDDGSPDSGWVLRLAVSDEAAGLAWAISAVDSV
jgi:hypothetical protein